MDSVFWWLLLLPLALLLWAALIYYFLRRLRKKPIPLPAPHEIAIEGSNLRLMTVQYEHPSTPPIVMVHGYAGNSRNWRELGYEMHRRHYDIWMPNLRGHGNGKHRSQVLSSSAGSYGFSPMMTQDYPTFLNFIAQKTQQKVCVIAHSMGGIAARAYASGVIETQENHFEFNTDAAIARSRETLASLILMGSPPNFHSLPQSLKWLMKQPSQLTAWLHSAVPVPSANTAPTQPDSKTYRRILMKSVLSRLGKTLYRANPVRGVAEVKNFNLATQEFARLLEKGISKVHTDLVHDMSRWVKEGNISTRDGLDLTRPRPLYIPLLFIAGEYDQLAPPSEVFACAKAYRAFTSVRTVLVRKTSHVDLISGERAANLLSPLIDDFMQSPENLGPDGTHLVVG